MRFTISTVWLRWSLPSRHARSRDGRRDERSIKRVLQEFNITHSTLQFEREDQANQNASLYGHGANRKEEENVQGDDGRG